MNPRISLFFPSFEGGGVFRVMTNLAKGFLERDYPVDLVVGQAGRPLKFSHPNLRIIDLDSPSIFRAIPKVVRYLRQEQPGYFISAQMYVNLTAITARWLAKTDTILIVSEHNDVHSVYQNAPNIKQQMVPILAKFIYRCADQIVAVSQGTADSLAAWLGEDPQTIRVIYNPIISEQLFTRTAEEPDHPWLQDPQQPVVLAVGRLETQKDYPTLLQAFALVRQQTPARLLILGEGSQRAALQTQIEELHLADAVDLFGYTENPYAYMSRAAVYVLSSAYEGYPTVLVEALACGCAVVSTDCPSGPAEILEQGKWGTLVPVGDAQALARAIQAALQQPPTPYTGAIIQKNSIPTITGEYIQLLEALSADKGSSRR